MPKTLFERMAEAQRAQFPEPSHSYEADGLFYFDTGGRFWTPEWDEQHQQGKTVRGARMADGGIHHFARMVAPAEAREWQAANGGIVA